MQSKLIALAAIAVLAGSASAIEVGTLDYYSQLHTISDHYRLETLLNAERLGRMWPEQVEDYGELATVVARINDPDPLNQVLGEGANLAKGDFVLMNAGGQGFGGVFWSPGSQWDGPQMAILVEVMDFYIELEKTGLRSWGADVAGLYPGVRLPVTVTDPEAFSKAFTGEGEISKGMRGVVTLAPGKTQMNMQFLALQQKMTGQSRNFLVVDGKASISK